jgi:hypothetical protein
MRAKARSDHWTEELLIVQKEIEWTKLGFKAKATQWAELELAADTDGLMAYAAKQRVFWEGMQTRMEDVFPNTA